MKKKEHLNIWRKALTKGFSLQSILASAATAYFALFSFFPMMMLGVAISSYWFDPLWVENEVITQLEFIIPGISQLLGANLQKIVQARSSVTTTALILLAWAGSSLFSIVTRILDSFWSGRDVRSRVRYRGLALLAVAIIGIAISPLLFLGVWFMPLVKSIFPAPPLFIYHGLVFITSVSINIIMFATIYRFLPHQSPPWQEIWIGAFTSGVLWELAKRFFVDYSARFLSTSNLVYGSVSTIMLFLVWVYFSGLIFLFGAHLNMEYRLKKQEEREKELEYNNAEKNLKEE